MALISVIFRSERGDEFPVNLDYDFDSEGKLRGEALPTNIVSAYGELLKHTYEPLAKFLSRDARADAYKLLYA